MKKLRSIFSKRTAQVALLAVASIVFAGAGDVDARFHDLGNKMMCMCGCGQVLLQCNHVGCSYSDKMRDELSAGLQRGDNDDLILQAFVQNYGATVLAAPIRGGFDSVAWITPFAVFGLASGLAAWVVISWKRKPPSPPPSSGGSSATTLEQFREQARKETEL